MKVKNQCLQKFGDCAKMDGIIPWEDVAQAALKYMDEDSIKDMNRIYEWVTDEENDEETEDELD